MPPAETSIASDERRSGLRTLRRMGPYLWPSKHLWVKQRVVFAIAVLVLAKLIAVYTPMLYKGAVDSLAAEGVPPLALGAIGLRPTSVPCPLNLWMNTPVVDDTPVAE